MAINNNDFKGGNAGAVLQKIKCERNTLTGLERERLNTDTQMCKLQNRLGALTGRCQAGSRGAATAQYISGLKN